MKHVKSFMLAGAMYLPMAPASAAVLTFDGDICNGGQSCDSDPTIDASYGDIAGRLDVQYKERVGDPLSNDNLALATTGYSDLLNVAVATIDFTASVFLASLDGSEVTLNGFDLGASQIDRSTQVTVVDGLGNILFSSGPIMVSSTVRSSFVGSYSSTTGIGIQFGPDAGQVGIDNIDFSLSELAPVPEPATWAMMIAGFGLLGGRLRLRSGRRCADAV